MLTEERISDLLQEYGLFSVTLARSGLGFARAIEADILRARDAKTLRDAASCLEADNMKYASSVGEHEPDTGAFIFDNRCAQSAVEATDDAIEFLRNRATKLEQNK